MVVGFDRILRQTIRRCHKPLMKLHDSLQAHRVAILAPGEHRLPPVASRPSTTESLVRGGRGYRNYAHVLLKMRFMIAYPIVNDDCIQRFLALSPQPPPPRQAA
jgi:hypothetical protein